MLELPPPSLQEDSRALRHASRMLRARAAKQRVKSRQLRAEIRVRIGTAGWLWEDHQDLYLRRSLEKANIGAKTQSGYTEG